MQNRSTNLFKKECYRANLCVALVLFSLASFSQNETLSRPLYGSLSDNGATIKQQAAKLMSTQGKKGFLKNRGQMLGTEGKPVPFVLFSTEAPGLGIYITEKGLTYSFLKFEKEKHDNKREESSGLHDKEGSEHEEEGKYHWRRMDVELVNASIKKENIIAETPSSTDFNYYLGHCPDGILGVKEYEKITIKEVYEGIDWSLYRTKDGVLKYDFVVHPGADPAKIKLRYIGAGEVKLEGENQLSINSDFGNLTEGKLYCYNQQTGKEIPSKYMIAHSTAAVLDDRNSTHIFTENHPCTEISINTYSPPIKSSPPELRVDD